MSPWFFLGVLGLVTVLSVCYLLVPFFRTFPKRTICVGFALVSLIGLGYFYFGGWQTWRQYVEHIQQTNRLRQRLQSVNGPDEVIHQLKQHLQQKPNSARGWFLLGRLYNSQNRWLLAREAFARAYRLAPKETDIVVNYAESLMTRGKMPSESRTMLLDVLARDPNQPDALALLALDAYQRQHYQHAIQYWETLLTLLPPDSKAAQAVHQAIVDATVKLGSNN